MKTKKRGAIAKFPKVHPSVRTITLPLSDLAADAIEYLMPDEKRPFDLATYFDEALLTLVAFHERHRFAPCKPRFEISIQPSGFLSESRSDEEIALQCAVERLLERIA